MEVDGKLAKIDYTKREGKLFLNHSEVPYELRGKGVGKVLVEKTLQYIKAYELDAVAVCSYIKAVAKDDSEWNKPIS